MRLDTIASQERYINTLADAASILKGDCEDLISIKVRPINHLPMNNEDEFWDAYVYTNEYTEIDDFLSGNTSLTIISSKNGITRYSAGGKQEFLVVKHETGPEIIVYLSVLAASLGVLKSVVELITTIIKTVHESNQKKKQEQATDRYHEAKGVSLEVRTKDDARIMTIIDLLDQKKLTAEELVELLKSKKEAES